MSDNRDSFPASQPVDFSKPFEAAEVRGKSAIVTGGASGIGEGLVRALAAAGATVTLADIDDATGEKIVADLANEGLSAQFVHADTANWAELLNLFSAALSFSAKTTIDIVIPCAGLYGHNVTRWLDAAHTNPDTGALLPPSITTLEVNLIGAHYITHLALHYFQTYPGPDASSSKQLIFIGSLAGVGCLPLLPDYTASKFGVRGLWKSLRSITHVLGEGKPSLRTNMIAPTFVRTPMVDQLQTLVGQNEILFAEVQDVVEGVMRVVADESIYGRALVIAPNRNIIDMCDDTENETGKQLSEAVVSNIFGAGFTKVADITMW